MNRCTAPAKGHSSQSGAAKCPACRVSSVPNMVPAAPPMSPRQWSVTKEVALPPEMRLHVAADPDTAPLALAALAKSRNGQVRSRVALNPSSPPSALATLINTKDVLLQSQVLTHPSLPPRFAAHLARTGDSYIRPKALAKISVMMESLLGIPANNVSARDMLVGEQWWEMEATDPAVVLAKTLFPDA